jgi:ribonucleotide reductase alpha subunit
MAFMMAMMAMKQQMGQGMKQSQSGGGSQAGGTTSQSASALTGDAVGREDSERAISRGSGVAARLPEEFREVLQDYFKAVEAMEGDGKR